MTSFPIVCRECGAEHDRKAWDKLRFVTQELGCFDVRECSCGELLTCEADTYRGYNDHCGATRNLLDANA